MTMLKQMLVHAVAAPVVSDVSRIETSTGRPADERTSSGLSGRLGPPGIVAGRFADVAAKIRIDAVARSPRRRATRLGTSRGELGNCGQPALPNSVDVV
ncbi:hypothetical protein GSI_01429 [Ganoderma sinense ZZ0214-1]|uniref:Uncharacterized protein n=1 Tax=Ganoderma sinense ZZ0214-1 TaxID=1077348 RepID=A0A2G8SVD6_9APHY|nr:hypothetical protein GSI_01429 [Ganoderma sinense ZZ0214-1]